MFSFSCALWAIFGLFSLLFFVRQPAIFLFTKAKTTQERTPNHRTIYSKPFLSWRKVTGKNRFAQIRDMSPIDFYPLLPLCVLIVFASPFLALR